MSCGMVQSGLCAVCLADDGNHASLTGKIERIKAEQVTERLHIRIDRDGSLIQLHAPFRMFDELCACRGQSASGRIPHDAQSFGFHGGSGLFAQWSTVAAQLSLQADIFPGHEHRCPMAADAAGKDDLISRLVSIICLFLQEPDAGRIDVDLISFSFFHDFRIASDDAHAASCCTVGRRGQHRIQIGDGEAFFQDQRKGQISRDAAAHQEIVHGAADRQLADIAAGKAPWADHEAVGGHHQRLCAGRHDGPIAQLMQGIGWKCLQDMPFDQFGAQLSAAAMIQCDSFIHDDPLLLSLLIRCHTARQPRSFLQRRPCTGRPVSAACMSVEITDIPAGPSSR